MGYIILIAGKGGTGKTSTAALLVRVIKEKKLGSVLAVDADPNNNLGEALGVKVNTTISGILDDIAAHPEKIPQGMGKEGYIEFQVQKAVEEEEGFDIITMGKPEGPGCYCYVNNVLRSIMSKLVSDYEYIIIDNEAGLEHLSRRTTRKADALLVISDETPVGLKAAKRIAEIVKEIGIKAEHNFLLINRASGRVGDEKVKDTGLEPIGVVPIDQEAARISLSGGSVWDLSAGAASIGALKNIGEKILSIKS